jgi:hypothetical protein
MATLSDIKFHVRSTHFIRLIHLIYYTPILIAYVLKCISAPILLYSPQIAEFISLLLYFHLPPLYILTLESFAYFVVLPV